MSGIAEYRRRTQARHRPVVAVASAPEVDACLARSGLTLVDALRPWSDVRGISFSVRLNPESGYPHVLNEFGVRFHDARECARVPDDVADAHAAEALTPWSPADAHGLASALEGVPSNVPSLIAHARGEDGMTTPDSSPAGVRDGTNREKVFAAPWLDAYHARFDRAMQFADHEAVDHPVGIVYAVMANTPGEDPAEAYRRLAEDPTVFPPVLRDTTLADADVPRHCLLVHDASSPSAPTRRRPRRLANVDAKFNRSGGERRGLYPSRERRARAGERPSGCVDAARRDQARGAGGYRTGYRRVVAQGRVPLRRGRRAAQGIRRRVGEHVVAPVHGQARQVSERGDHRQQERFEEPAQVVLGAEHGSDRQARGRRGLRQVRLFLFTYAQLDTDVVFCLFTGIRSSRR